jgi:hypothetical protein
MHHIERPRRGAVLFLAVLSAIGALSAIPAAAGAATSASGQPACAIVIGKAAPGKMSPVRDRICGTKASVSKATKSETLLMEWFENADNSPPSLTRITGTSGPCDRDGYRLRTDGGWINWDNEISGFNAYNDCEVATGYDLRNLSGDRQTWSENDPCSCLLVPWVGGFMNDRIESFWIRAQ